MRIIKLLINNIMGKNNTGVGNSGHWNSGNRNSGYRNSGGRNSGDWNSGDWNSGDWNSGSWNSGDSNSGNWNSGNRNSGYLNTNEPTVRMFDLDTGMTYEEVSDYIPGYFYFYLCVWVSEDDMTQEEKDEVPAYETTGGYLKTYEYKEAWRKAWDEATQEDREKTLRLPNWDNEKFEEITGIDVEKELNSKETVLTMDEVAEKFGVDVDSLKIKKD